jgi:hypothetical protein
MPEKPEKPDRPSQGQTLSLRISDALHKRLERAKQLLSSKTGENVTTSEVAKQLLESAREDRFEVADLMENPTDALLQIRKKGEAQHILSRPEWILLTHFVQRGLETYSERTPNPVSSESLIAVLDAFLAVYDLRTERTSARDTYYFGNLPFECRPAKGKGVGDSEHPIADVVRKTVIETRKRVTDSGVVWDAYLAARNLHVLLEDEKLPSMSALTQALRPYWPALWRLAARGHYCQTETPLRAKSMGQEPFYQPPIPSIKEADFTLSFSRGEGGDLYLLLSFPCVRGATYPLIGYPKITEFRAMLKALTPDSVKHRWEGENFLGYVAASEEGRGKDYWFRAHQNGITFGLTEKEWKSVRTLFHRAWELPEIRMVWDALTQEYGEL